MGIPFKLADAYYDLYYFVIFANNDIVETYRVYENGYSEIFSENTEMINGLKNIASLTSSSKPAKIIAGKYDDIYAIIDSVVYPVFTDPEGISTNEQNLLPTQTYVMESVVNACNNIDFVYTNNLADLWDYLTNICK